MKKGDTHGLEYYFLCLMGGSFSYGLVNTLFYPLDIYNFKTAANPSIQTEKVDFASKVRRSVKLTPILYGYSIQGFGRFGFYEIFKDVFKSIVGQQNQDKFKEIGWLVASGSAEIVSEILLSPWKSIKPKIQFFKPDSEYLSLFGQVLSKVRAEEGIAGTYKGIVLPYSRQVPYTIFKFVAFEQFVQLFYGIIFTKGKENYNKPTQLSISFASGCLAGILCAIASHPVDTMVNKLYSQGLEKGFKSSKIAQIYSEIGFKGLWAGLATRTFTIGALTGLQWLVYDSFKTSFGLSTTGGDSKKN